MLPIKYAKTLNYHKMKLKTFSPKLNDDLGNDLFADVINSTYNERPKNHPKCPKCGKKLSPAGGTLDGSEIFWVCWNCGYKQEDIPSLCL